MPRLLLIALFGLLAPQVRAATELRIVGMQSMAHPEAVELISARLEFITKRPASASRADDAAFLLERLLVQRGFTDPEVEWSLPDGEGGDQILLTVKEGSRSTLGGIYIKGVDAELLADLQTQIKSAHKARSLQIGDATPFLKENNSAALTDSQRLLQSKGYWDAKVRFKDSAPRPGSSEVDIFVEVEPGPMHHLLPLQYEPSAHPDLVASLDKFAGRPATTENIRNARARVEHFYRKRGHQRAEVKMLATHQGTKTQLRFLIKPGPRYLVGEIAIDGAENVKPQLVKDRFREFPGEPYDSEIITTEIRDLLGTGAFSGIRLDEDPQDDGTIDLTLHVTEAKPRGYYYYAGAGSFEGLIIGAGYYHRNLFGNLWNLSTRAEWSGLGLLGEVSVTEPRFLGYDLRFTTSAHLTTRTYEGYSKAEAGLAAELEWDVGEHYVLKGSYKTSYVTTEPDGLPRAELGPHPYLLQVLGLSQTYDRRDNPVLPKDGFLARLDTDLGLAFGTDSVSFLRGEAQLSYYKTVLKKSSVALGARTGMIVPNGTTTDLPVDLRYFLGGGNSVRSFPERELGPTAFNDVPRGGESYWVANAEFIQGIVGPLNGVLFLDVGSLSQNHFDIFSGDIKYTLGLGLRLNLPIGPVRLEYGHALNPEGNDPVGAFHFAIGSAF